MQISMPLWWSFILFIALAMGLAACDSPSMAFQGVPAQQVTVDGATFSVRHTVYDAEAIRTNVIVPPPRRRDIVIRGVVAIENASGCKVDIETVRGDTNIVASDLICAGVRRPIKRKGPPVLDCVGYELGGFSENYIEVECDVIE